MLMDKNETYLFSSISVHFKNNFLLRTHKNTKRTNLENCCLKFLFYTNVQFVNIAKHFPWARILFNIILFN